jgi:ribonuclease BN (tRNA processing enzyme)
MTGSTTVLLALALASAHISALAAGCPSPKGPVLQILGSGGPIADDGRASSGYLLWVDGSAKVLIDAGSGTFLRFGESGAKFKSLDFVGLSHFHTDHSADFPALLKSGSFSNRERSLVVAGPDGSDTFPGINAYLRSMLDDESGAYRYLSGYLDGTGGLPKINAFEIAENDGEAAEISTVYFDDRANLRIDAMHVPHGIVPALAFRVQIGKSTIVFASDQNGNDDAFVEFARNADVLVMHMVVPEGVSGIGRRLHAPPSVIGAIAKQAHVDTLVLSHFMARSLRNLDQNVSIIKSVYDGRVILANDLDCVSVN